MRHTIIAVFDNRSDAQGSIDELLDSGYPRQDMRLSEGDPAAPPSRHTGGESLVESIKHFFVDIFGTDRHEHALMYEEAIRRGNYVLTLTVDNEPDAERAADIIERFRPLDLDDYRQHWLGGRTHAGRGDLRVDAGARQQADAGSQQKVGPGGQGASAAKPASTVNPESLRDGVRIYRHGVPAPAKADEQGGYGDPFAERDDDVIFRSHWSIVYASADGDYEDYAPAYRYGLSMAKSELYGGRAWPEVEQQLKTDWEKRNPGSAWERFKAAIRHGWERIAH
ncbi:MAG: hypothetical protein V4508_01200 [Pseudomonadota bacterium]